MLMALSLSTIWCWRMASINHKVSFKKGYRIWTFGPSLKKTQPIFHVLVVCVINLFLVYKKRNKTIRRMLNGPCHMCTHSCADVNINGRKKKKTSFQTFEIVSVCFGSDFYSFYRRIDFWFGKKGEKNLKLCTRKWLAARFTVWRHLLHIRPWMLYNYPSQKIECVLDAQQVQLIFIYSPYI